MPLILPVVLVVLVLITRKLVIREKGEADGLLACHSNTQVRDLTLKRNQRIFQ